MNFWIYMWGVIFFVILLLVNWVLFRCYQKTEPKYPFSVRLWRYFGTNTFKAVTISLLIPVVIAMMGGIFEIGSVLEERIRSEQELRTEKRWECVQLTAEMWDELYSLTSEVRHFQIGSDEEENIHDLLKRFEIFSSSAEDTVNEWSFRFPNLTTQDRSLMLQILNILYRASSSVAYYIQTGGDDTEISKLKYELGVIQGYLKNHVHHSLLIILKESVEFLRDDKDQKDKEEPKKIIEGHLKLLEKCKEQIDKEIEIITSREQNVLVFTKDDFQDYISRAQNWQQSNPEESITEWSEYNVYYEIPIDYSSTWIPTYSKETIEHLAKWMDFQNILINN